MQQGPLTIKSRPPDQPVAVRTSCLVATMPRSGSWLMSEALHQTGLAGQPAEYFRPDYRSQFAREWGLPDNPSIDDYVTAAKTLTSSADGIFSAKLHWYQFVWLIAQLNAVPGYAGMDPASLMARVFPHTKYVYLFRQDRARQAVSYFRAAVTQDWFKLGKLPDETKNGHRFPQSDLQQVRYLEDSLRNSEQHWESFFSDHGIVPFRIAYEEFVASYATSVIRVLDFLGVSASLESIVTAPRLNRQSDDASESVLEKYLACRDSLLPLTPDLSWSPEKLRFVPQTHHPAKVSQNGGSVMQVLGQSDPVNPLTPLAVKSNGHQFPQKIAADTGQPPIQTIHKQAISVGGVSEETPSRAESKGLPDSWRRWVATCRLDDLDTPTIVAAAARQGIDEALVRSEIEELDSHPYFLAAMRSAHQLKKLESVLEVSRTLAELSDESRSLPRLTGIGREDFVADYYSKNRAVLLDGIATEWAAKQWTMRMFRDRYGDVDVEVMAGRDDDPHYEERSASHRTTVKMTDYIAQITEVDVSNDAYIVANNHFFESEIGRDLMADLLPLPEILHSDAEGKGTFLWLGPRGTVTPLHHDVVNILFVQLYGRKRFVIAPPDHTPLVYNRRGVFSDLDPEQPDLTSYPLAAQAKFRSVILEPGDAMFLPVGWWHHVRSLDLSMSVSFTAFNVPNSFEYHQPRPV